MQAGETKNQKGFLANVQQRQQAKQNNNKAEFINKPKNNHEINNMNRIGYDQHLSTTPDVNRQIKTNKTMTVKKQMNGAYHQEAAEKSSSHFRTSSAQNNQKKNHFQSISIDKSPQKQNKLNMYMNSAQSVGRNADNSLTNGHL